MRVLDLFSGIGGFSLGLERAGMETVAFCEIEPFCQKVLKKHWPEVPIYNDVREITNDRLESDGIRGIDVICGGFPCQDISVAGKQAGITGERSGLWSEMCRIIDDIRPRYAIMENVTALISGDRGRWFGRVLGDLAEIGFDAEWHCIPASELGAHHHRDRVWIIAYPKGCGSQGQQPSRSGGESDSKGVFSEPTGICGNVSCSRCELRSKGNSTQLDESKERRVYSAVDIKSIRQECRRLWETEPELGRTFDGFPDWLDKYCGEGMSYEKSQRTIKTLRNLWTDNVAETLWREIGGLNCFQKAQILFSIMREYEKDINETRLFLEGKKTSARFLRELRRKKESTCPSHRPEQGEQQSEQHSDSLQMVSQLSSFDSETSWKANSWEDGIARVANGIPNRSHRLKGLGNAVVPQIPELIGRAILESL